MTLAAQLAVAATLALAYVAWRVIVGDRRFRERKEWRPDMHEFLWLDQTRLNVYEFKRGTKVMRISASDMDEAESVAAEHHFHPPFDRRTIRRWDDHLLVLAHERKERDVDAGAMR